MKSCFKVITVLFFMLVSLGQVQATEWQSFQGPPGSFVGVRGIVVDPTNSQIVYAGTWGAGMFKSFNGGMNWVNKNNGLGGDPRPEFIDELIIDPNNPDILYLGNETFECIWKSIDGGETWVAKGEGLVRTSDVHLAIHPTKSNIIVAAFNALPAVYAKTYISFDGAETWHIVLEGHAARSVAIAPDTQNITIYVGGGWGCGLAKTIDAGTTWVFHPILDFSETPDLAIDPNNPDTLYATGGNPGKVAKSIDGGTTWFLASDGLPGDYAYELAIDSDDSQVLYVTVIEDGVFKSINGGQNWFPVNMGLPPAIGLVTTDPSNPQTLYIASWMTQGIFKSTDGGELWTEINCGLANTDVHAIAVEKNPTEIVYASASYIGCFRTTDKGQNWQLINEEEFQIIRTVSGMSNIVFGAGSNGIGEGDLYKSDDMGDHWTLLYSPPGLARVWDFVVDASDADIMYAGYGSCAPDSGLVKSTDGGDTWQESAQGINCDVLHPVLIRIHPTNSDIVFAAAARKFLYRSDDAGENWEEIEDEALFEWFWMKDMAFDPINPMILYVVGIDQIHPPFGEGIILKSEDGGETWQNITNNIVLNNLPFTSVVVNSQQEVFVGTYGQGVYKSTNGGQYWSEFNEGFLNDVIRTLTISEEQETELYAGLVGAGVFYRSLPTGIPEKVINKPTTDLLRICPNPFQTTTTINYSCPSVAKVSLKVYDSSGRLVKVLVDGLKQPGNYMVNWSSEKMANGIYFAELVMDDYRTTKKMIILK